VQEPILLREVGSGMRQFVEEYLERNGVLRQQLHTFIDMNSTEGIVSAVEAGLGVGFVPRMAAEKALKLGSVVEMRLDNGPIHRQLSIALLNGPDPRGPVGLLVELLRNHGAENRNLLARLSSNQPLRRALAARHEQFEGAVS